MAARDLLYRFPSSQSSSPTPDVRHSWPIYQDAHPSHISIENGHSEFARKPSASSIESFGSSSHGPLRVTNENIHPSLGASHSAHRSAKDSARRDIHGKLSNLVSYRSRSDQDIRLSQSVTSEIEPWVDFELSAGCRERSPYDVEEPSLLVQSRFSYDVAGKDMLSIPHRRAQPKQKQDADRPSIVITDATKHPFRRWMKSVRRRSPSRRGSLKVREERWSLDDFDESKDPVTPRDKGRRHKKSSSWSSSSIVTAVKSATAGLAVPRAQKSKRSTSFRKSNRSSGPSEAANRISLDNSHRSGLHIDEAAWERARQRRRTLEEIVSSEESYVADLKVLVHVSHSCKAILNPEEADGPLEVYFTLLESASNVSEENWARVHCNIKEILSLHEELLLHVRRVMREPDVRSDKTDPKQRMRSKHTRWRSQDGSQATTAETAVPVARRSTEISWLGWTKRPTLVSGPHEAAEIAQVFDRMVRPASHHSSLRVRCRFDSLYR